MFDYEDFLGIDESASATLGDDLITGTFLKGSASIKAGFDIAVHFAGGQIDASVPVDVTIETTYNKTTDTLLIDPQLSLGGGVSFSTMGPEGSFLLDFIFQAAAELHASLLYVDLYKDGFSKDLSENIFDLSSADWPYIYPLLPGIVDIGFEWPHLSVTGDTSGSGTSNDFLFVTLDVDQLANALLGGILSFIDSDPLDSGNFELLDFDITGGLNFIQEFALGLASTGTSLVLEDGTVVAMTFGTPLTIGNVSAHDQNGDGSVSFSFALDPEITLSNKTILGGNLDGDLWLPKNFDYSLLQAHFDIVEGPLVTVYEETFGLAGVGSLSSSFFV